LGSETLKSEYLFEAFLDISDYKEFQKVLQKYLKEVKEIQHLDSMTAFVEESKLQKYDKFNV
jgi:hypothetical protein